MAIAECISDHELISEFDHESMVEPYRDLTDTVITKQSTVVTAGGYGWKAEEAGIRLFSGTREEGAGTDKVLGFETKVGLIGTAKNTTGKLLYTNLSTATPTTLVNMPLSSAGTGYMLLLSSSEPPNTNFRVWSLGGRGPNPPLTSHAPHTLIVVDPSYTDSVVDVATEITHRSAGTFDPENLRNVGCIVRTEVNGVGDKYWILANRLGMVGLYTLQYGTTSVPAMFEDIRLKCDSEMHFLVSTLAAGGYLIYAPVQIGDSGNTVETVSLIQDQVIQFGRAELDGTTSLVRNLHAAPNRIGLEYSPITADTHTIESTIIQCESSYYLYLKGSVGSTCVLSNSTINTAGSVDDKISIEEDWTVTNTKFSGCGKIGISGASLTGCSIINPSNGVGCIIDDTVSLSGTSFLTSEPTDYAIEIDIAGTYNLTDVTYTGFTTDINVTATSGTVTLNIQGGDSPTYVTAGATVVLEQAVTLAFTGMVEDSVLAVYKDLDDSEIISPVVIGATGAYSTQYSFTGDTPVTIKVRKSTTSIKYLPFRYLGTITTSGLSLTVNQVEDTVA